MIIVEIDGYNGTSSVNSSVDVKIAGNLNVNGGNTSPDSIYINNETAGLGGYVEITIDQNPLSIEPVYLMGYDSIVVDGGEGIYGAEGGSVDITSDATAPEEAEIAGPIFNLVDISANGASTIADQATDPSNPGDEVTGNGASGGYISLRSNGDDSYLQSAVSSIDNSGTCLLMAVIVLAQAVTLMFIIAAVMCHSQHLQA